MKPFFIPRLLKDKAFTLTEALFTITILAMVLVAMTPFIRTVYTTWNLGDRKTELQQNARVGLEMLSRFIRQAKRITGIPEAGMGNFIKFRDAQDTQTIIFYHNVLTSPFYIGNTGLIRENDLVMRTIDIYGVTNNALLAKSLSNFILTFKDNTGALASRPYNISSLDIDMSLTDPQGLIPDIINLFSSISVRTEVRISKPVWVAAGNYVIEVLADNWLSDFSSPNCVAVNNSLLVNGKETIWVADTTGNRIRRIYWDGSNWTYATITGFSSPRSVSVNSNETVNSWETCWVADTGGNRIRRIYWTGSAWTYDTITGLSSPRSVSANPNETINGRNTCWVADTGGNRVRKIYWDPNAKPRPAYKYLTVSTGKKSQPYSVSVNTADGTCWVANSGTNNISKLSSTINSISIVFTVSGFSMPYAVSVDSVTGECWVADTGNNRIKKISPTGITLLNLTGFNNPQSVGAYYNSDINLSECWVADTGNNQIVKLDSEGNEEFRISGFQSPLSVTSLP